MGTTSGRPALPPTSRSTSGSPRGRWSDSRACNRSGRVAVPIALATGRPVVGVDSSPAMLDGARRRADEAGVELVLHLGDMADLRLDELAALIICPFRALLHVPSWAARRRVFERVAASLRPSGRFAGTRSPSTTTSPPVPMVFASSRAPLPIPTTSRSATTVSTSSWTTEPRAPCGGRPRTNGSASSTLPASRSSPCTATSMAARSATTAPSTSSSPGPAPLVELRSDSGHSQTNAPLCPRTTKEPESSIARWTDRRTSSTTSDHGRAVWGW